MEQRHHPCRTRRIHDDVQILDVLEERWAESVSRLEPIDRFGVFRDDDDRVPDCPEELVQARMDEKVAQRRRTGLFALVRGVDVLEDLGEDFVGKAEKRQASRGGRSRRRRGGCRVMIQATQHDYIFHSGRIPAPGMAACSGKKSGGAAKENDESRALAGVRVRALRRGDRSKSNSRPV